LLNIELQRKMRRVAVQTQRIGMQLCWQVFVDEPGRDLGVADLVHEAQPEDSSRTKPPDAPAKLADQEVAYTAVFEFAGNPGNTDRDEDYIEGAAGFMGQAQIAATSTYAVIPPAPGFTLGQVRFEGLSSPIPGKKPWAVPDFSINAKNNTFDIRLSQVNFDDSPYLTFKLKLLWRAPEVSQADLLEYAKKSADYTMARQREEHAAYVKALRDRVTSASNIEKRPGEDLRDEERTAVFRRILVQLTHAEGRETSHVTSELIREIFDIEQMLYFVAPDWWAPRARSVQALGRQTPEPFEDKLAVLKNQPALTHPAPAAVKTSAVGQTSLTADDISGWGGTRDPSRANYLITATSQPAPLGASLGWLIQLDGDDRRNAFLNTPWAKAVVPIRPGKEAEALAWLQKEHVEGVDGLDATYAGSEADLAGLTVRQAILTLARDVAALNQDMNSTLIAEKAFETGFDPLDGGFRAPTATFAPFDQWIEVLPTDQVVAREYDVTE
jgi:hypothetical protein